MAIEFTSHQEAMLQHFLAFEGYENASQVIDAALDALKRERDLAGIKEGIEDMEAGRFRPEDRRPGE